MQAERWQRIDELFGAALDLAEAERAAFLTDACAGDHVLRGEVEALLASHQRAGDFIQAPAFEDGLKLIKRPESLLSTGRRIGQYEVIREIGRGGMGTVYLAARADDQYKKHVAIKLIKRGMDSEDILQRFRNERQILASLDHPNIARLLDGGTTADGLPYFVMEYVEGFPLLDYCDTRRLPTLDRLKLFRKICGAVQHAHQNLVVHRDIKPSNIIVAEDGTPKLLDFGIAKVLGSNTELSPHQTATVARMMTPQYASPEQVRGKNITTASDIHSLGVLLYKLLTGHHPYQFNSLLPTEIERVICEQVPEKPSAVITRAEVVTDADGVATLEITPAAISAARSDQPERLRRRLQGDLDNIVLMAIQKEPERRYASVELFSEDISRHLEGLPVIAATDSFAYRAAKFIRRHKASVAAAAFIFVALLAGLMATVWQARIAARERDAAQREKETAQRERVKAEKINAFLQEMLNSSDPASFLPNSEKGHEVTVKEALDEAARMVEIEMADQPDVRAALQLTIGNSYLAMGRYNLAEPHLRAALETNQKLYGDDHEQTVSSYSLLGTLLNYQGKAIEAEQLYRKALPIYRKLKEAGPVDLNDFAVVLNDYAVMLRNRGRLQEGEALLREGLEFAPQLPGKDHATMAIMRTNLALMRADQGYFDEAEAIHRVTIGEARALPGRERIELAHALRNLADVLIVKGELDEAASALREAEELFRKLVGKAYPNLALALNSEAYLLYLKGDFKTAEAKADKALEIFHQTVSTNIPGYSACLTTLGLIMTRTGRAGEAEKLLREALKLRTDTYGDAYFQTALTKATLGECLMAQQRYREAESWLTQSYETMKSSFGEQNPRTIEATKRLAMFYEKTNRPDMPAQIRAKLSAAPQ